MKNRPIVWALLFLVAGILWGRYLGSFVGIALLSVLWVGLLFRWQKYPPIFLCLFLALAGFLCVQQSLEDNVIQDNDAELIGIVNDMRYTRAGWQRLEVLTPYRELILTYLSPYYRVEIGQKVKLTGELHPLAGPRNPGGYNEFMVQRARGISGKFYARDAEIFEIEMNLARATHIIRNRLAEVYNTYLPHRFSMLIQSIVLGERPDMDDPVVEMYRMAGIYHLLVVSGLHLSILMMAICFVLERFISKRKAGLLSLFSMIGYTLLTGASISTVRSVTMAGVAVFGRVLYRDRDSLASVSFACILLLLFEPLYLFAIGFQLSFGTVFGLILLTKPTERALARLGMPPGKFRPFLAYNIVATMSTYPILAFYFSYISTYSILVNIIIMPTATILVITGFLMGITGLFSTILAQFLAGTIYFLLQFYEAVIRFFLALPASTILLGNWGLFVTLAAMGFMLVFGYAFSGFGAEFPKRLKLLMLASIILLSSIFFESLERRRFNVTALDIEAYVISAAGYTVVVDGGGNNRLLGTNTGAMVLIPYLNHRGISRANAAFATDASRQRITGLIELTMANRVEVIYVPANLNLEGGLGMRLRTAAERNNIAIYRLRSGAIIEAGGLKIEVLEYNPRFQLRVLYGGYKIIL